MIGHVDGCLDALNLSRNLSSVCGRKSVGLETLLGGGISARIGNILKLGEPLHVEQFFQTDALMSVLVEQGRADVLGGLRNLVPRREREIWSVLDGLSRNFLVIVVVEGKNSGK